MQRTRPWCSYDRKWWRAGRSAEVCSRLRLKTSCVPTISVNGYNLLVMCTHSKCGQLRIFAACSSSVREFRGGSKFYSRLPRDSRAFVLDQGKFLSPSTIPSVKQTIIIYNIIIGTKQLICSFPWLYPIRRPMAPAPIAAKRPKQQQDAKAFRQTWNVPIAKWNLTFITVSL